MKREGAQKVAEFAYRNIRFSEVMVHWLVQLMVKAQASSQTARVSIRRWRGECKVLSKLKRHFEKEKQSRWLLLEAGCSEFYSG